MIGVPHPKWSERPLLVIVRAPKSNATKEEILTWLNVSPLLLLTEGLLHMSALGCFTLSQVWGSQANCCHGSAAC